MNKLFYFHKKSVLTVGLIFLFIWSLFSVQWGTELFHSGGLSTLVQILDGLIHPNVSIKIISLAIISSWKTLAYAVAGMTIAIFIGLFFGVLASGILINESTNHNLVKGAFRGLLGFMRSIHELVWGWLFVAAIGINPFAAIFAIAIPYGGILGRIFADILNDVPKEPIESLKINGASKLQIFCYGYLPLSSIDLLSYTFYRFECAIRSSAIMSFIGLGGLGYQIDLSLSDLKYDEVWTFMFFLITLITLIDLWSQSIRKRLVT